MWTERAVSYYIWNLCRWAQAWQSSEIKRSLPEMDGDFAPSINTSLNQWQNP